MELSLTNASLARLFLTSAGLQGLPEKKVLPPTVPESPAFALKKRVQREPEAEEVRTRWPQPEPLFTLNLRFLQVKQPPQVKAPQVPHFGLPFQPHLPEDRHVEVCPFSFEEREQERRVLKEKKMEERRLEEVSHQEAPSFRRTPEVTRDLLPVSGATVQGPAAARL